MDNIEIRRYAIETASQLYGANPLPQIISAAASIASFIINGAPEQGEDVQDKPKAAPRKKATKVDPQPEPEPEADEEEVDIGPTDEVDKELLAPVDPMPDTAKQLVDAGTGKPADGGVVKMTFDDVKVAAAKLAAKDTPALAALLKKYGAPNLSGVPKAKLPDFVGEVMTALEGGMLD